MSSNADARNRTTPGQLVAECPLTPKDRTGPHGSGHGGAGLLIRRSQLRDAASVARLFNARGQVSAGIDDRDTGCHCGGESGEAAAVQPQGADRPGCPGRYARHRAAAGGLVAPGQCRGARAALDADTRAVLDRKTAGRSPVQDDPLHICPGNDHRGDMAGRPAERVGAEA